jgi:phage-related protein
MSDEVKPVRWIASSRRDLKTFPEDVRDDVGFALYRAQQGLKHSMAKPLKGFDGPGVLEVVADYDGDTYRAVYTVRFAEAVYVLHCFQKKSKSGIATPKPEIELIKGRLKSAQQEHEQWQSQQKKP